MPGYLRRVLNEDETEKRIAGLLLDASPIASIDNVNGELGGDLLCQALTQPQVRIRRLGGSDLAEIECRTTLFATGNGLRVRGDMVRRTLLCSLDAGVERPELRAFGTDPVDTVLSDRGAYVAAALTLVRAFMLSGAPRLRPLGSFRAWSDTVRSALVWLGCADPCETMETAREEDPELEQLRALMAAWDRVFPDADRLTARAVISAATATRGFQRDEGELVNVDLNDAIAAIALERGGLSPAAWAIGCERAKAASSMAAGSSAPASTGSRGCSGNANRCRHERPRRPHGSQARVMRVMRVLLHSEGEKSNYGTHVADGLKGHPHRPYHPHRWPSHAFPGLLHRRPAGQAQTRARAGNDAESPAQSLRTRYGAMVLDRSRNGLAPPQGGRTRRSAGRAGWASVSPRKNKPLWGIVQ